MGGGEGAEQTPPPSGLDGRARVHTQTQATRSRAHLIVVTPVEDQQPRRPAEMSIRSTDTHLAATSVPISGACRSTRCNRQRRTPPPLHLRSRRLSQKGTKTQLGPTDPDGSLQWSH